MGLNIWGAFKRAITLPKAKNSVSDVLGAEHAAIFRELAKPLVDEVLEDSIDFTLSGIGGAVGVANRASRSLVSQIERLLGRVVSVQLEIEIQEAIWNAVKGVPNDRKAVRAALQHGMYQALKL